MPKENLSKFIRRYYINSEVGNSELPYYVFLTELYILDIDILKFSTNPLVFADDEPNSLLVIVKELEELSEVDTDLLKESF